MRTQKTRWLVMGSATLLVALLVVQGIWIYQSATIKEAQFGHRVSMALYRTADAICADNMTCKSLGSCCLRKNSNCEIALNEQQKARVDSLLHHYMDYFHVQVDYHFEILREEKTPVIPVSADSRSFQQKINTPGTNENYLLRIQFPEKSKFIRAEMGPLFIISALLVLGLVALFGMTLRALSQDRRVLQRTTDFVNNMVHEFRTPLTNITLATNMLGRADLNEEKRERFSGIVRSETERLKSEVERFLQLAELEKGEPGMELKETDMRSTVEQLVHTMEMQAQAKGGKITVAAEAQHTTVTGDPVMLANAVRNLLDNAIKYAKEKPEVEVRLWNEGNHLFIAVSDNGIGIEESQQKMIFDRFYRVSSGDVHDVKGFGLGLAYVKKVALLHRGEISLKSEPGKGSTFTVRLPLA